MADDICEVIGKYKTWSLATDFSDHRVVLLQLEIDASFDYYPFKCNPSWLKDEDFNQLIHEQWGLLFDHAPENLHPKDYFLWIINNLRLVVIDWERKKKKELNSDLERVEVEIHVLTLIVSRDSFSSS